MDFSSNFPAIHVATVVLPMIVKCDHTQNTRGAGRDFFSKKNFWIGQIMGQPALDKALQKLPPTLS